MLKLPEYARRMGISRAHAHALFVRGELPHPAQQIGPRTILVDVPVDFGLSNEVEEKRCVAYVRVSSHSQKESLSNQKLRILDECVRRGIKVDEIVEEIGSGMNPGRKKINRILADSSIELVVVEHRERLARFNFDLIESALKGRGASVLVVDDKEIEDDLVRDVTEVLTSLCARMYGQRSARIKAEKIAREALS